MISATIPGLPCKASVPGVSTAAQAREPPHHLASREVFLRQEELALASAEARRKRIDVRFRAHGSISDSQAGYWAGPGRLLSLSFSPYDERTVMEREVSERSEPGLSPHESLGSAQAAGNEVEVLIDDPHNPDKLLDVRRAFPGQVISYRVGLRRDIEQYVSVVLDPGSDEGSRIFSASW